MFKTRFLSSCDISREESLTGFPRFCFRDRTFQVTTSQASVFPLRMLANTDICLPKTQSCALPLQLLSPYQFCPIRHNAEGLDLLLGRGFK